MTFKSVIQENKNDIAFIVGNGINRHNENPNSVSWDDLLLRLWRKFAPDVFNSVPKGITITEFYDLLDLASDGELSKSFGIQKEAARILDDTNFAQHHVSFIRMAKSIGAPVLTTNFDLIMARTLNLEKYFITKKAFTDFYPWSTYYGDKQLDLPTEDFGIWFLNGFIEYHRSIRLGLSHYMGSVQRARTMIHGNTGDSLFKSKDNQNWVGQETWLHILFNKNICVFGLGLEENEVFIRWILIERAKYFKKFPERKKLGWYVAPKVEKPKDSIIGKRYFLESIGLKLIEAEDYNEIYDNSWG